MKSFLGVDRSITGRRWLGPDDAVARASLALQQQTGASPPLCNVLAARGIDGADLEAYLEPRLRDHLPDPRRLKDMDKATDRFLRAVKKCERIAVFADYDVDGGSSAALLVHWLRAMDRDATLYVPDRIEEGYGPNVPAMKALAAEHDLIICVDCGTLSHEPIAAAAAADVIVLDHHLAAEDLPPAIAVVNPNRQDESGALGHLCAAAVVFLFLVETNRLLREEGTSGPDLMALLDLVALATVADVAPLIGVNRALVRQGLKVMAGRGRPGLVALSDGAGLTEPPSSYHLGFVLGPRINAGGRVGRADLGARLLSTDKPDEAQALAARLEDCNTDRREVETRVRLQALEQVAGRPIAGPLAWAAADGWHPGVVGIVASRVKEVTNRPSIIIGFDGDSGKGSGRSVAGIDLGAAIQRLAAEGLIERGGGHRMAVGLSLSRAQLEPAMDRLSELLARQGVETGSAEDLRFDGVLMPGAATPELVNDLERAGPFGAGAPAPRFAFPEVILHSARRVGDTHQKIAFSDGTGQRRDGISFGAYEGPMGSALETSTGRRVHLAGRLEINTWGGRRSVQLRLEDAAET